MAGSRKRKILWTGVWLLVVLAFVILTLPIWFPWVLRPVAASKGAVYTRYAREGYSRFTLRDLTFTNSTSIFRAGRISGLLPTAWLWAQYVSDTKGTYVNVENWSLVLRKGKASNVLSVIETFDKTAEALTNLRKWLPRAALTNGVLELNGERIELRDTVWQQGDVTSRVRWPKYETEVQVRGDLRGPKQQTIRIDSQSMDFHSVLFVAPRGTTIELHSTNFWRTNPIEAHALFAGNSWIPQTAAVEAREFKIPGVKLGLPDYQTFEGNLVVKWQTNRFALELTSKGTPAKDSKIPPAELELHASGDLESAVLEKAHISAPGLDATLKPGTHIQFASPYLFESTTLELRVDLAKQSWVPGNGRLEGQADLRPGQGNVPELSFSITGPGIQISNIQARTFGVQGELVWPELRIRDSRIQTMDGSSLTVQGIADLANRMVHYGNITYEGVIAKRLLPPGYDFTNASAGLNVSGAWTNLEQSGKFQIKGLKTPWTKPLDAVGRWKAEGLRIDSIDLGLRAEQTTLDMRATLDRTAQNKEVKLASFKLSKSGKTLMDLEKPVVISFEAGPKLAAAFPLLKVQPLHWMGPGGDLRLQGEFAWPAFGTATGAVHGFELQALSDLFSWATNQLSIGQLELAGGWSNGPLALRGNLQAEIKRGIPLSARTDLSLDPQGIHIKSLTITNDNQLVGSASAFVPITLHPGSPKGFVQADPKAALDLKVSAEPRAFSEYVRGAGVALERPDLQIRLEGTLDAPRGQIDLAAAGIQFAHAGRELPPMEDFRLHATVDRQIARVTGVQFAVAKQPVEASGEIPLGDHFWSSLSSKRQLPDWKTAKARIQASHAQLGAFKAVLPKILSPEGELEMDVSLIPGGRLNGHVTVSHARTYPIASLGSLREILVRLRFEGQKMLLEAAADLGGQPVPITGSADFSGPEWLQGQLPPFELKVGGAAVPLSRSPELILKADLDLKITREPKQPVTIGGTLNLRDGYYLRDISVLTQGKTATPSQRPPYFSISEDPMAQWRLKLNVTGKRFLKVRSPLFNGQISTVMHLQGTLREPIAIGDVSIDSGDVRFPFATLPVTQGIITLTSENPYHPQVAVAAGARTFGYDIKMDITGSADAPVIQFSSTPPLSSEQILLMISAGELPRGELNFSSVQKAQRLALFIGKDLLSELGFAGDANRLTIRSGEDISEAGKPTYSVEYKLRENWSVIGEYDRFNDFNLMLKWRLYSK